MPKIGTYQFQGPLEHGGTGLITVTINYRRPQRDTEGGFYANIPDYLGAILGHGRPVERQGQPTTWSASPFSADTEKGLQNLLYRKGREAMELADNRVLVIGVKASKEVGFSRDTPTLSFHHVFAAVASVRGGEPVYYLAGRNGFADQEGIELQDLRGWTIQRGAMYHASSYNWVPFTPERYAAVEAAAEQFRAMQARLIDLFGDPDRTALALDSAAGGLLPQTTTQTHGD